MTGLPNQEYYLPVFVCFFVVLVCLSFLSPVRLSVANPADLKITDVTFAETLVSEPGAQLTLENTVNYFMV